MRVLVTGGTGFIGRRLVKALLQRGHLADAQGREQEITALCVSDVAEPPEPLPADPRIETAYGDFSVEGAAADLVTQDTGAVFHLAAIVSGQAEQEFDLGMRINLDGTRRLLEACRALHSPARLVFSSSVAAYGGDMPEMIEDTTPAMPQTSYGSQKVGSEYLISDYSRKDFVDGRSLRLPTIVVRVGKPNAAASSFASGIIREPLQGEETICPVSAETGVWLLSPRAVVDCFLHAATLPAEAWGMNRTVALPGMSITVGDMLAALREVGGAQVADRVRFEPDPFIERIVYGWPTRFSVHRAAGMGFKADDSFKSIIEAFIQDDLGGHIAA
mgnify:FL=1